jgi:hypothetical protein
MAMKKFNQTAFSKQNKFPYRAIPLIIMEIKKFNHTVFAKQIKFPRRARTRNFNGHPG